jgi:phosphatidylserine decarboxylase
MKKIFTFWLLSIAFLSHTLLIASSDTKPPIYKYNVAKWTPTDQQAYNAWFQEVINNRVNAPLQPVIQEFKDLIENDPELFMLFTQMYQQLPDNYTTDPTGETQIKNYEQMLQVMNKVLTIAPSFNKTGLVGFPINAILNWPMATPAGRDAFRNAKVNEQLKKILNQWATFLASEESRYVLNDNPRSGWFGEDAKKAMPTFEEDFICDPQAPYYGFTSWDDFFTRKFRPESRPVAEPENDDVIVNACESAPYKLAKDVKYTDEFWIKSQPYSLKHMLNNDPLTEKFVGGTVYQAFLSAESYHRWNSPVSGTIVKTTIIDGTYYAEPESVGYDPAAPNRAQGFISQTAARGLVFIEADNPDIGLMAILFIGMAEVSSTEFTVFEGEHVNKGDELGMFHYGGSTHCLIFQPGVDLAFDLHGQTPGLDAQNILVRQKIATVKRKNQ